MGCHCPAALTGRLQTLTLLTLTLTLCTVYLQTVLKLTHKQHINIAFVWLIAVGFVILFPQWNKHKVMYSHATLTFMCGLDTLETEVHLFRERHKTLQKTQNVDDEVWIKGKMLKLIHELKEKSSDNLPQWYHKPLIYKLYDWTKQ